jgi:hypothetical protein
MYSLMMCVQDEVALDEDGHLVVRVHQCDVFRLREQVNVADFEVHAFLEQHETAAVRVGVGGAGVKDHHGLGSRGVSQSKRAAAAALKKQTQWVA